VLTITKVSEDPDSITTRQHMGPTLMAWSWKVMEFRKTIL